MCWTLTPEKRIKSQMSAITITNVVDAVKSELVAIEPTRFGPNGLTENGRSFIQVAVGGFRRIKPTPQVRCVRVIHERPNNQFYYCIQQIRIGVGAVIIGLIPLPARSMATPV